MIILNRYSPSKFIQVYITFLLILYYMENFLFHEAELNFKFYKYSETCRSPYSVMFLS